MFLKRGSFSYVVAYVLDFVDEVNEFDPQSRNSLSN